MLRKLWLVSAGFLAVPALGATAPSAFAHDPGCNGNNLPLGIYKPSNPVQKGKFDLELRPPSAWAHAESVAGALLCGTDDAAGRFYAGFTLVYPNKREFVSCARRNPPKECKDPRTNRMENVPDGSYAGWMQLDAWCASSICGPGQQLDDLTARVHARYDTGYWGGGPSRCTNSAGEPILIACYQAEYGYTVGTTSVRCDSDLIVNLRSGTRVYRMRIYQPDCDQGGGPLYPDNLDTLYLCAFPELTGAPTCVGAGNDPVQRNGRAGWWTFTLQSYMVGTGQPPQATDSGQWT